MSFGPGAQGRRSSGAGLAWAHTRGRGQAWCGVGTVACEHGLHMGRRQSAAAVGWLHDTTHLVPGQPLLLRGGLRLGAASAIAPPCCQAEYCARRCPPRLLRCNARRPPFHPCLAAASLDPLGIDKRPKVKELDPAYYGFTEKDLDRE